MPTAKPATHRLSAREGGSYQKLCFRRLEMRTAKMEKLTRVGIGNFLDWLGENSQRFKPRCARIWDEGKPSPLGRVPPKAAGEA